MQTTRSEERDEDGLENCKPPPPPTPNIPDSRKGSFRRVESTGTASMVSIDEGQLLEEDACNLPEVKSGLGIGWG